MTAVPREQNCAGQAVLVSRAEICPVEAESTEPLVRHEVENSDLSVVAFGDVERAIVRRNGGAQKDALRIGIGGIEARGNLRHLGLRARRAP